MAQYNVLRFWIVAVLAAVGPQLGAQTPTEPTAYTVTVLFNITGPAPRTTYRLGSKVLADQQAAGDTSKTTRTLYNLQTLESLSWDPNQPSARCVRSDFHGAEWQDPFSGLPDLMMKDVLHVGRETVHGIAAEILESKNQTDSYFRLWVDPQTGLMLKSEFVAKKLKTTMTYFEVTEVSLKPPPASIFEAPVSCASATKEPVRR